MAQQAAGERSARQAINSAAHALERQIEAHARRARAAENIQDPKRRRVAEIDLDEEARVINEQRAICNRVRRRIAAANT